MRPQLRCRPAFEARTRLGAGGGEMPLFANRNVARWLRNASGLHVREEAILGQRDRVDGELVEHAVELVTRRERPAYPEVRPDGRRIRGTRLRGAVFGSPIDHGRE